MATPANFGVPTIQAVLDRREVSLILSACPDERPGRDLAMAVGIAAKLVDRNGDGFGRRRGDEDRNHEGNGDGAYPCTHPSGIPIN